MSIIKLRPSFKDYIWGGNRLNTEFGFESGFEKTAEAWVLSCHKDGDNTVLNGAFQGSLFSDVIKNHREFLGKYAEKWDDFPVLIKFIDACDKLSVQVHPDEKYANEHENGHGKTECWVVLDAQRDAELILGFKESMTKEQFRKAIESNTLSDYVNHVKVKKGEAYFIPSGTIHGIGKGILIAEVQQNSNSTYRVYDYNRLQNGKPRELHIEKAVDVCNLTALNPLPEKERLRGSEKILVDCDIFMLSSAEISKAYTITADKNSFVSVICINGRGEISSKSETVDFKKGDSIFIPANEGNITINGSSDILITRLK